MKTAPTKEEILQAYGEKLAAEIETMSDEEVQAKLAEFEDGEGLAKLAADQEALGRFMHIGYKGAFADFDDFLKEAEGDVGQALDAFEEDLEKMAGEIAEAEELAEKLAAGEAVEAEVTPEEAAISAAGQLDPEALKTAALAILEDKGVALFEADAEGNPTRELALA